MGCLSAADDLSRDRSGSEVFGTYENKGAMADKKPATHAQMTMLTRKMFVEACTL